MNTILETYRIRKNQFEFLKDSVKKIIEDTCSSSNFEIHSITARVKEENSLEEKILNKGEKYKTITDITDIIGFRIITLFEDDVKKVSSLIKKEFNIDEPNSQDKAEILKTNEFGYRSVHFICSLKKDNIDTSSFKDITNLKFEIQIRSILQHSWAEIEHKLGYKNEFDIPDHIKRDFSRVAGLLELADMEFIRIRKNVKKYSNLLDIKDKSKTIPIDIISLTKFANESDIINSIENQIASNNDIKIQGEFRGTQMTKVLKELKVKTLSELEILLEEKEQTIIDFTTEWIKGQRLLRKGLSIWTLAYIMKAEQGRNELEEYFEKMNIGGKMYTATNSDRVFQTLAKIKST